MIKKRGLRIILTILLVTCLIPVSISSNAKGLSGSIEEFIKTYTISTEDEDKSEEIPSIEYDNKLFLPIEDIARMLGKNIITKGQTIKISDENKEEDFKLKDGFLLHGFYALNSYDQFEELRRGKTLTNFDSLSFGWSRIDQVGDGVELTFDGRDFRIPNAYDETLHKANDIPKQLMIFADDSSNRNDYFKAIFKDMDNIISQIADTVNGKNNVYKKLAFDGVTIDFETVNKEDQDSFITFLKKLRIKLGKDKTIYVAIPSVKYYSYYKYKEILEIVDYVILMEHDFDMKVRQSTYSDIIKSPVSPIALIEQDIKTLVEKVGDKYKDKIILQISFGSSQWISNKDNTYRRVMSSPSYNLIYDRICKELDNKVKKEDLLFYNKLYDNPYLIYINDKKEKNHIWYENWDSVFAKIKLASDYNLGGISLWRLGTVPNYYSKYGKEAGFDIWYRISNLFDK
ncbi:glycosyl hydrolase family 18 protein [Vallitalea guaymasensis]|uniref:glycosyl hydrolase family 18 protein n=1 Tax=Vallitalea guaymasensis TaxID=1185412 RepID=UPI000DE33D46|nr:glycosyl hydrolase family 18 protein [Vallitalea guaymasensis]